MCSFKHSQPNGWHDIWLVHSSGFTAYDDDGGI